MKSSGHKINVYQVMTRLFGNTTTLNREHGSISENGVGKFNDITDLALRSLKKMGITHMWYTGVLEHALTTDYSAYGIQPDYPEIVKGKAGSPYAIKDYYDVNPDLAVSVNDRISEFEQLIARTHNNDLRVLIDFVANHVARLYHSEARPKGVKDLGADDDLHVAFRPDNNFYYLPGQSFSSPVPISGASYFYTESPVKVTGNDQFSASPGINDWYETVKLNYGLDIINNRSQHFDPVPDTWNKMKDILVYWSHKKVDGFRCDMAEMVPVEFWSWVIPKVKAINKDIIFIAEVYNPSLYRQYLQTGCFDYLYDKVELYDTLRQLTGQQGSALDIIKIRNAQQYMDGHLLHFMENHDEQRIASHFFAGDAWKGVPAMVVSATIDKGPLMIYFGQEIGEPAIDAEGFSTADGRTTIYDYWGVREFQKWVNEGRFDGDRLSEDQKKLRHFYTILLSLTATSRALREGEFIDLTTAPVSEGNMSDKVLAFARVDQEKLIILAGFSSQSEKVKLRLSGADLEKLHWKKGTLLTARDILFGEMELKFDENFECVFELPAYSGYVFKINE